jgi:flagellar assembly protein FliH
MPTVIKSGQPPAAVPFNFDDLNRQGEQYLERVRAHGAEIVAKAQEQAAAIRQQAEVDGRAAARAAAEREVGQQLEKRLETLWPALRQTLTELQSARHACLRQWEAGAIHVAAAIAERIVRRELAARPEITLDLIRETLHLAAGSPQWRLLLNPADHAALRPAVERLVAELSSGASAEIVADPAITPGGCRVETRFGSIDQQIAAQLARIEEELSR